MMLPWADWQFWVVTAVAAWGAWAVLRGFLPGGESGTDTACSSCAAGAAACSRKQPDAGAQVTQREPPLVVLGESRPRSP